MNRIPNDQRETDKNELRAFLLQSISGECIRALNQIDMNLEYSQRSLREADAGQAEELRQALSDASVASSRLDRTLDSLFRLLACTEDEPAPQLETVELCGLLQGVCADAEAIRRSIGVQVSLDCGGAEELFVTADRAWLEWICLQLLSNALRACEPGGRVLVRLCPGGAGHRLCVQDNGCGLPETAPAGKNRERFLGGTGLGLRLCREYCRRLGWTLELTPRPEGGVQALVCIPAQEPGRPVEPRLRLRSGAWEQLQQRQQLRHAVRRELRSVPGLETAEFTEE